ncbi:MAG: pilus assembly protein [Chloroflexi bacterium]|nr:MAG: pilus assembly protein [Chloroflexota bacterium]
MPRRHRRQHVPQPALRERSVSPDREHHVAIHLLLQYFRRGLRRAADRAGQHRPERDRPLHVCAADPAAGRSVRHVPPRQQSAHDRPGNVMPAKASTGQRSQALIEFALISPVLLLLVFGIIDIGRAVFYYDTLAHAAREGAREAISASTPLPTDASVLAAVMQQLVGAPVTAPCPQGRTTLQAASSPRPRAAAAARSIRPWATPPCR